MSNPLVKKLLDHPDKDEIISKLVSGESPIQVSEWLKTKYVNPGETRFALSSDQLKKFSESHLDMYLQIREDLIKSKDNKSLDKKLRDSVKNNKSYKERINELAETEVDIKKTIRGLIIAIEGRAEQVFDQIQDEGENFRGDTVLINWFNLLLTTLEKGNKILNDSPDQVIQHNVTVQVVDQHVNIFYEAIKETIALFDYETSLKFMELFNEKLMHINAAEEHKPASADIRLAEAKLLSEKIVGKLE